MIRLNDLNLDFGGNPIFENISIQVKANDRIGLIGNNGSGKTTLLNLISEKINPTTGSITKEKGVKIGYLPQELHFNSDITLKEFVVGVNQELVDINERINEINRLLQNTLNEKDQFKLLDELDALQYDRDKINILKLEINAEKVMKGLGFSNEDFPKNINSFSGGWKMRAELSRLLISNPDILLLDEPTNHLDLPAIIWLENFLNSTKCATILVSHDIKFLDKNVNRIFNVSNRRIKDFKGNYTKYIDFREGEIERQIREKKNQEKYVKQANKLIEKFRYKKNKAAFAQTLIRRLDKMEDIEIDSIDISSISFQFPKPLHCGNIVFQSNSLGKSYNDNIIFENLNLDVYKGDRIAFVGKNGCGKTTLTKIINNEIDFNGEIKKGEKVVINYFAQNQNELLDPNMTIMEYVESIPSEKSESQLRGLLGAFLFSGDDVYKKTKVLSGGEKARLSLCGLLLSPSNVIILDEPTNHLDVFAKDILKQALVQYTGTLVIVSHDRSFLSGLTDRVIEFTDKKVREYPGDIDSYLKEQEFVEPIPVKRKIKKANPYKEKKELNKKLRTLNKKNDSIELEIEGLEKKIEIESDLLKNVGLNDSSDKIDYNEYTRLNNLLNVQLEIWESNQKELALIQKEISYLEN